MSLWIDVEILKGASGAWGWGPGRDLTVVSAKSTVSARLLVSPVLGVLSLLEWLDRKVFWDRGMGSHFTPPLKRNRPEPVRPEAIRDFETVAIE
jgi:hypothetical protein